MDRTQVGVRELKMHLSEYIQQVKAGRVVVITEHGRQVGRIVPVGQSLDACLQAMAQSGLISWSGRKPEVPTPVASRHDRPNVADLLIEDRG
mgnify:CR=1 FL=1